MIRDPAPIHNLGFGAQYQEPDTQQGLRPNASVVEKALSGHPFMRFLAVSAATMVGMHVAGKMVAKGGIKLAMTLEDTAKGASMIAPYAKLAISDFRKVQKTLDEWQGITRTFLDPNDEFAIFRKAEGKIIGDTAFTSDSYFIRREEINAARRRGLQGENVPAVWTWKQELQQRMVAQARRLPYELPGAYLAQRTLLDPVFGPSDPNEPKVKWYNPIDVLGDFANQSVKNLATMVIPFEAGSAAAKTGYRNLMTSTSDFFSGIRPVSRELGTGVYTMRSLLSQVGADASNILNSTVKFSQQSAGAFSAGVRESLANRVSFGDWIKQAAFVAKSNTSNAGFARRQWETAQGIKHNTDLLNALPGPFGGLDAGIQKFKTTFKDIGMGFDTFQSIASGRLKLSTLQSAQPGSAGYRQLKAYVDYMRGGGFTDIEQYGAQVWAMGRGGPLQQDFKAGTFYRSRRNQQYRELLSQSLQQHAGLSEEKAAEFVRSAAVVMAPRRGELVGDNLIERLQFSKKGMNFAPSGDSVVDLDNWFKTIRSQSGGMLGLNKNPNTKFTRDNFVRSVRQADVIYGSSQVKARFNAEVGDQWNAAYQKIASSFSDSILARMRVPYESFQGNMTQAKANFLQRRVAQELGVPLTTPSGAALSPNLLKQQLRAKGMDPENTAKMTGFLIDRKVIAKPWSFKGANMFGLNQMSVAEGFRFGYFQGYDQTGAAINDEIAKLITTSAANDPVGRSLGSIRMRGVYKSNQGTVLDFNRLKRGLARTTDIISDEIQTPFIHMRPFNLLGYSAYKGMKNTPIVGMIDGDSWQPFLSGGAPGQDFYLWMRNSGRGTKGKVTGFTGGGISGPVESQEFQGLYRPFTTNINTLLGKHARLGASNLGQDPLMGGPGGQPQLSWQQLLRPSTYTDASTRRLARDRWKNLFRISQDQSESVFGFFNRVRQFRTPGQGMRSPVKTAAMLADRGFSANAMTEDSVEGVGALRKELRNFGLPNRAVRRVVERDANMKAAFRLGDGRNALDVSDTELPSIVGSMLDTDLAAARKAMNVANPGSVQAYESLRRSQAGLRNLLTRSQANPQVFDETMPQAARSFGIHRRIDQFRTEFYGYLMGKSGASFLDFQKSMSDVFDHLDELRRIGKLSGAELAESRAALLGLQVDYYATQFYKRGATQFQITQEAMNALRTEGGPRLVETNRQILEQFSQGKIGIYGRFSRSKAFMHRELGLMRYEHPGVEYNPFGSSTALVPTFGTAFERNPVGAIGSVLGFNTWSTRNIEETLQSGQKINRIVNPTFSGSSVISSHFVYRLNRYFETFNLGIDPTKFKGPLDYYARGMVGMRVLPIVAAGATALAADRTIGAYTHPKDMNGNRVYSPFFLGLGADLVANTQMLAAGIIPGGQTYKEKEDELKQGEVPIRQGRFWLLGNTPFKGGRIQYYRPSWYQRLKAGGEYTPEMKQTPVEKLLFGYDFSPLRPVDPYRFERKNYNTRPYPVSGDYFSGPWGPLTGALNATIGRVLKPRVRMHQEEMQYGLQQYLPVGESGAYLSGSAVLGPPSRYAAIMSAQGQGDYATAFAEAAGTPGVGGGTGIFLQSMGLTSGRGSASLAQRGSIQSYADMLSGRATTPATRPMTPLGVPTAPGRMSSRVVEALPTQTTASLSYGLGKLGYESQELMGIYGFGAATFRTMAGIGNKDLAPDRALLEPAHRGYSTARSFWGMNLGGLGDFPSPLEGQFSNLEISEIVRRFVPKEQAGLNYINPLPNDLGQLYPWLPGINYPLNPLKTGDPYGTMPDATIRLPGSGYMRTHQMFSDQYGKLGLANIHDILGDVAPWSQEYKAVDQLIDHSSLTPDARAKIQQTRAQVDSMRIKNEFTPYKYKYSDPLQMTKNPTEFAIGRAWEWISHRDTFLNTKFLPVRTAAEDWERENVYGATFPTWEHPINSFLKPMLYRASQRDPLTGALAMGGVGMLFGTSPQAKAVGSVIGGAIGFGTSLVHTATRAITGDRFIPLARKKELELEEYTDILSYTRSSVLASRARAAGNDQAASFFEESAKRTMYGADLQNMTPEQLAMAIPKRKREHFRAMIYAPPQEREKILSTAGRLERRIYEAAWGMPVEQRPNLQEYYQDHELPSQQSTFWSPQLSMDAVKIKIGNSMGLDMAQMGYYPQQIKEANLINPTYPNINKGSSPEQIRAQLDRMLYENGIAGDVRMVRTPFGGTKVQIQSGVF